MVGAPHARSTARPRSRASPAPSASPTSASGTSARLDPHRAEEAVASQEHTGDAATADTSRKDAASTVAEEKAERSAKRAERSDDAAEEASQRTQQAAEHVTSELAGLGAAGEGEAPVRAVELLGRLGLVGYGLVHVLIGAIAVHLALTGGGQPDQQGALTSLVGSGAGVMVIIVAVVGLVAFALWQGLAAATGFRWTSGGVRFRKRVGAGAKTIAVLAVAIAGIRLLLTGSSGGSSSTGSEAATAGLLAPPP